MPILIICRLRLITLTIFNSYFREYDNNNETIYILKNCSNQTPLQTLFCDTGWSSSRLTPWRLKLRKAHA